ncbi:MAG: MFS transporter, partial [Deltaproteobacteria bacterium]|nr:MFS transporter [Deltaproteobacteria bacterium]
FVPDKFGVRPALLLAFVLLLGGRVLMSAAPTLLHLKPDGLWSPLHLVTMAGIILVLVGYGMYQPAAYTAVRQFTTPKTAAMSYAMLYALMNAGSALTMGAFLVRDEKFLGLGISGAFWIFTALTLVSLLVTVYVLSRKTVDQAIVAAQKEKAELSKQEAPKENAGFSAATVAGAERPVNVPVTVWISLLGIVAGLFYKLPAPWCYLACGVVLLVPVVILLLPAGPRSATMRWISSHPLADARFFFFIFALIPVQTLFTYNWLVLPQYISRAFDGWIGEYFEIASNANPILIFVLVPVITALTYKKPIYTMMIIGTTVMGASAFVLALGPTPATLVLYIVLMTVGEALWQPRFLQYATEIAPEGRAGLYQGVAQLPWFLTKFLVPLLYSGEMVERYCPATGPKNTETMWLIFGLIAISSAVMLVVAKGWVNKGQAKAA